ncbi:MAG TPA: UDP-2,3-diacylglucosamine diphosphatase LpxI [Candidatus Sumerlaeota bacterium]|nr:UDP-2,3-diacylglucosamine diphosphatase LpxI [Candidatus Sumerlaeota bacterium]HMZ52193.1 UDP-2,3-diacylglucosamine diphosphatase LpxI [Candidatus Sumerlaeota bacterium]HNM45963.1 UDP-2,3-diacylglucosamine diphosphatase LpxI [Candidatus Sumerlaeota bacterium]
MGSIHVGPESRLPTIPPRIGLIAGEGDFPLTLAKAARSEGVEIITFGINGLANDRLREHSTAMYTLKLSEISKLVEHARTHKLHHVIMAGRVPHNILLKQISFDPRILRVLGSLANKRADSLLSAAVGELEKEGIKVLDSTMFLKSCMPEPGILTKRLTPSEEILRDIDFGYPIAKEIGRLDIGQAIAVRNGIVLAVEALEGTDALIERVHGMVGEGWVLVKVSKPRQDMRFDVPVVGLTTIRNLAKHGAVALCLTAHESLFFDRQDAIPFAEQCGINIIARGDDDSVFNYVNATNS